MPTTVTLVTSAGGTATVIDQSDVVIEALTTALTANTAAISTQSTTQETSAATNTTNIVTAITAQTTAMETQLLLIRNILTNSANALVNLKSEITALAESVESVKDDLSSMATSAATTNAILSMRAANEIKKVNFEMSAAKESLARSGLPEPTVPSFADQANATITDSKTVMSEGQKAGFVTNQMSHLVSNVTAWIENHLPTVYLKNAIAWVERKATAVFRPNVNANAQDAVTKASNVAGTINPSQ